ncbi:hypothetical protein OS493_032599 [Desmophyllum pertusum]|uniref:Uncharacterized protein n=1 Tax=Desmophyllum pertusum TaxID=174260 RepID=A0A9W9YMJ9_9CNID|nr:hypothetical protein OS493_032599 [Desmophyllum pertusum]
MKKQVLISLIAILYILASATASEEEKNHLSVESFSDVTGAFSPSARNADVPLHSTQHKFTVQTSPISHSLTSDNEQIGSLDGIIFLPASTNGFKPMKWNPKKTKRVSAMRKLAMRRAARKHKVFIDSSHGVKRHPTASISRYSKGKKAFMFQSTPPSSSTGVPYKDQNASPPQAVNNFTRNRRNGDSQCDS